MISTELQSLDRAVALHILITEARNAAMRRYHRIGQHSEVARGLVRVGPASAPTASGPADQASRHWWARRPRRPYYEAFFFQRFDISLSVIISWRPPFQESDFR